MAEFLGIWSNTDSMFEDFEGYGNEHPVSDREDYEVLFGYYSYEDYSGLAFVLARKISDGNLYEVNGGHCSCYGLEGQWSPEETGIAVLRHRLVEGNLGRDYRGRNEFADELTAVLDALEVTE
ncbi:hypothetical protein [Paenibacillus abyssi]|uniref:Uncharacterized protein n=1 Tax=Paenibacillus abyssi TaxID=1340531 RepID=A0A917CIY2_9BACL|nr:hypothetical protein [Paenibacillus abyssi]GGF88213.1 hypothetical protein GCM10010916_01890 [Paenibacillus abyssi]